MLKLSIHARSLLAFHAPILTKPVEKNSVVPANDKFEGDKSKSKVLSGLNRLVRLLRCMTHENVQEDRHHSFLLPSFS